MDDFQGRVSNYTVRPKSLPLKRDCRFIFKTIRPKNIPSRLSWTWRY